MCADPKMMRLLASELREELTARKAVRDSGEKRRWQAAACAAVACITLVAIL